MIVPSSQHSAAPTLKLEYFAWALRRTVSAAVNSASQSMLTLMAGTLLPSAQEARNVDVDSEGQLRLQSSCTGRLVPLGRGAEGHRGGHGIRREVDVQQLKAHR